MKEELSAIEVAEQLLQDWPRRLAMIPTVKPLSANWMPPVSPISGRGADGKNNWWSWSPDEPARLRDETTGQWLPNEFPYCNHAAFCSYKYAMTDPRIGRLGEAYALTGKEYYVRALVELLVRFGQVYPTYPVTIEEDAPSGRMRTYGPQVQGTQYTVKVGHAWLDTEALQLWLGAYRPIHGSPAVSSAEDHAIRELAREIIEFESLPNFLYVNDKYHNSLTNYYEAFALVAYLWGDQFQARDTISQTVYSGADLAQLAINGPKGLRMFVANAFDRNGIYWELSASYTGYIFTYLARVVRLLHGYSDLPGYQPGKNVQAFFQPIRNFNAAVALPELWRAVLAQLRIAMSDGYYLPTNDTNYLHGPDLTFFEWWAEYLKSPQLEKATHDFKLFQEGKASGLFSPLESVLMPASGAATLRGAKNRFNVHLDWHRMQDYHSHKDPLNIVATVNGYLVLSDLGYHLGHPLRHLVSERTAAHNTVTVDGEDSGYHERGVLHSYIGKGGVQLVEASVPGSYWQCDLYRRCVVLVGDRYLLDLFRVRGGASHDYALLSRADDSQTNVPMTTRPGTLADAEREYTDWQGLDTSYATPSSPYTTMHHVRAATEVEGEFRVDWRQRDRPDLVTRVHHLTARNAEVVLSRVPHHDRRAQMALRTDEILLIRRHGAPPLESTFASVIEVLSEHAAPLAEVNQLQLASRDKEAIAVQVNHEDGIDLIFHALNAGPHSIAQHPLLGDVLLRGTFAVVRVNRDGASAEITMLSGELSGRFGTVIATASEGARVLQIDFAEGTIHLDQPWQNAGELRGEFVRVRGSTGLTEWWRVRHAVDDRTLRLDIENSGLVVLQGTVEAVENERTFWSGLNLCSELRPGTPIRIGEIGDLNAPCYHLEYARQTGLLQRVGGTTTNWEPRRIALGLDKSAKLTAGDVGKMFWTSGIEVGDYIFTQPVTRREVKLR
jgi:hypothetical protein